jgi:uncharacterized repeat protein (TIGR03803 family)
LHHFRGGKNDGSNPAGNLLRDAAGNIYGTTTGGGTNAGVVYKLNFEGHLKMVYSFTGGADGLYPSNGVIADAAGNLYGTTTYGGITVGTCQSTGILPAGCGVVFKVDPSGNETVLHAFTGGADGKYPLGPLTIDSSGNLYGTASAGGTTSGGVVFELPGVAVPLWLWPSL